MKKRLLRSLLPLALATGVCAQSVAPASGLAAVTRDQKTVDSRVAQLTAAYRAVLEEMRQLGTGKEDIALVEAALAELATLREEDMEKILAQLDTGDAASLSDAYAGQKLVAARLRSLVVKLQLRQQELAIAERARELAQRQAANQPPTSALKTDTPPTHVGRVKVTAEQQAIREETLSLVEQVRRLRSDPQNTPSESLERLSKPESLDALKLAADAAIERLGVGDFAAVSAQQALLFDRLSRLAELGQRTPPPAEAARAAVAKLDSLLAAQKNKPDAAAQAALAAQAEALRPQVDGLAAAAGAQLRQAADAMRQNAEKPDPAAAKAAEEKLAAARDLLEKQAEQLAAAEAAKPPATPENLKKEADLLAQFAREAQALKLAEEKLIVRVATAVPEPPVAVIDREQIELTRRTAALQQQVQAAGHEAAAPIGQAAVRMAESLSTAEPGPTTDGAAAARQTAVERLAQAVELLTAAAKEKQNETALAQAAQDAQKAAEKLADASEKLAESAKDNAAPSQSAKEALSEAQQALAQAAQAASALPSAAQQALSESWKEAQEAAKAAQQGDAASAQASAEKAAAAAQKAQAQLAQGPGQGKSQGTPSAEPPKDSKGGEGTGGEGELAGSGADAEAGSASSQAGISPRERDALAAARRQPVPRGYAGMVESYLENLSATP